VFVTQQSCLQEGTISVGGVDISELPLGQQRTGMSIVPQEPVMFTATLRDNLDPYHIHPDSHLLALLDEVGLGAQASSIGGLEGMVAGSGSDRWSQGQMQLVCLVRAALNNVPLVCLDEATSSLDPHTEHYVLVRFSPVS
jgi:ABC-type multidrug transport system fused ATPase/permease subunit